VFGNPYQWSVEAFQCLPKPKESNESKPISLYPLTPEQALPRAMQAPVPKDEPKRPPKARAKKKAAKKKG